MGICKNLFGLLKYGMVKYASSGCFVFHKTAKTLSSKTKSWLIGQENKLWWAGSLKILRSTLKTAKLEQKIPKSYKMW